MSRVLFFHPCRFSSSIFFLWTYVNIHLCSFLSIILTRLTPIVSFLTSLSLSLNDRVSHCKKIAVISMCSMTWTSVTAFPYLCFFLYFFYLFYLQGSYVFSCACTQVILNSSFHLLSLSSSYFNRLSWLGTSRYSILAFGKPFNLHPFLMAFVLKS